MSLSSHAVSAPVSPAAEGFDLTLSALVDPGELSALWASSLHRMAKRAVDWSAPAWASSCCFR